VTSVVTTRPDGREARRILDTEWDLLGVLWACERATAREVADALQQQRGWAYSTVKTLLDRLVERGLVRARKVGNVWEYEPAIQRGEAQRTAWDRFVRTVCGGSLNPALEFLAKDARLSKRERERLERLLEEEKGK
jgi:BlaI family penicillinase repressor